MKNLIILIATFLLSTASLYAACGYTVTVSQISDGPNFGDAKAQAVINSTGGTNGYYFYWSQGNNFGLTASKLTAGNKFFVLVDSVSNCRDTTFFTITDTGSCPNTTIQISEQDTCFLNDVTLQAYSSGGQAFNYQWSNGATTSVINGLTSGTYAVTATLVNNTSCTYTASKVVVDDTCDPCANFGCAFIPIDSCFYNDVDLYSQVFNSHGGNSYLWSTGATTPNLYNQASGVYSLTVTDSLGCSSDTTINVVDDTCNPCFTLNGYIYENDSCSNSDASLYVYGAGGSGNYGFLWSTGATTNYIASLTSGTYSLTITDLTYNCSKVLSYNLVDDTCNPCDQFNANIQENDSCLKNDVILHAYISGGSGSYGYTWNNGSTSNSIYNLASGNYSVTVTDLVKGCSKVITYNVVDDTCNLCNYFFSQIYEDDSCGFNDATLTAYVYYGSGSYSYLWSDGSTSSSILNPVSNVLYKVTITDLINGCVDTDSMQFIEDTCDPCSYHYVYLSSYDSCHLNDIFISCYTNDSSSNTTYLWSNGATTQNLNGVSTGIYYVTITFASGCVFHDSISVEDSNVKCCESYFYIANDSAGLKEFYSNSYAENSIITSYKWTFGDNSIGNGSQVSHSYPTQGSYTVCHYIETANGCKDTSCQTVIAPPPGKNLKVVHFGSPYVRDTFKNTYISYENLGTTPENAVIEYSYPAGCSLRYSYPSPSSNIGNKLTFNVGQLAPGQNGGIYINLDVPVSYVLGSLKNDTSKILTFANDIDSSNNIAINTDSVVGSWDPNEKLAYPKGAGAEGNIAKNTKEINYLIHFQNEGNFRTYRVRVEDEIDPAFDMSSLILGDVSHPSRMVVNGSKIVWYFDNIELTPKSQDEARSQGFISYSLKLKEGLPEGTKIQNTANIYFDKNPAIVTNTTLHTLKVDASTNGIHSFELGSNQIEINRNQFDLSLSYNQAIDQVEVFSMSGQKVIEKSIKAKKADFEISSWPSGIYIFHVKVKDEVHQLKIKL